MSERLTLREAKRLKDEKLYSSWMNRRYPFDMAQCGACLAMHAGRHPMCEELDVPQPISLCDWRDIVAYLRANLAELFALREKYKSHWGESA